MTRRHLFYLGSIVLWALPLAVVAKLSLDRLPVPTWGNPAGGTSPLEVTEKMRVGQLFVAPLPGLYRIDVVPERIIAGSALPMTFHLRSDPATGQDIWTTTFTSDQLQDGRPFSFEFPLLRDSSEQTYYFYLEAPGAVPGTAVAIGYGSGAELDGAGAYVNGQPVPGNLQFQTFYSLRTRDKANLLLSRMAEGRPYIFGSKGFYVGLGLAYALALCAFLLCVARAVLREQQDES
jgi:hypothetical protein